MSHPVQPNNLFGQATVAELKSSRRLATWPAWVGVAQLYRAMMISSRGAAAAAMWMARACAAAVHMKKMLDKCGCVGEGLSLVTTDDHGTVGRGGALASRLGDV